VSIGVLGNKVGMTQIFDENGSVIPVTVIKAGPCIISQIKTESVDGYNSVQVGYLKKNEKNIKKTELGHFKKANILPLHFLKEYRLDKNHNFLLGQVIDVEIFSLGQYVNVKAKTIGKGFSGNQRRHNFARGPMTHGSKNHRAPGSIGAGTTPGRVFPGKKMAGQKGSNNITISNLKVVGISKKENLLIVKGSIPGKPGNLVNIIPSKTYKN
jgi:large subunit ribosomal protein L3